MDVQRLAAAVPEHVRGVCAKLTAAGHQAVTVGGAVRDALLGRAPGDWDVATSARPEEVMAIFRHTIATGIQHGTVTVVTGKGKQSHVEVTTFRGEGAYTDARRPDTVTFGVPLREDLARRDLVVNAMAYDPAKDELIDPFGGLEDIANRRLRAVGSPVERFTEDGLRVMRAVRFAAQLEFDLDPDTEAGIAPALPSLAKVSRERVSVELRKLLDTPQPSRGLRPALRTGIIATILPELAPRIADVEDWVGRVDRAEPAVRLAALLVPLADRGVSRLPASDRELVRRVGDLLRALKFSNAEADLAAQLVGVAHLPDVATWTDEAIRRALSQLDKDKREHAVALWAAEPSVNRALVDGARHILARREPLAVSDLAISGKDLMAELNMRPGPAIGRILAMLLDHVLEDPTRNTREALLARAQRLELQLGR